MPPDEQHVLGFDVPMDDALVVRVGERRCVLELGGELDLAPKSRDGDIGGHFRRQHLHHDRPAACWQTSSDRLAFAAEPDWRQPHSSSASFPEVRCPLWLQVNCGNVVA